MFDDVAQARLYDAVSARLRAALLNANVRSTYSVGLSPALASMLQAPLCYGEASAAAAAAAAGADVSVHDMNRAYTHALLAQCARRAARACMRVGCRSVASTVPVKQCL